MKEHNHKGECDPTCPAWDEKATIDLAEPLLQLFAYAHLPLEKQEVSKRFHDLAHWMAANLPRNVERTTAIRRLREAKDCAVTSTIFK